MKKIFSLFLCLILFASQACAANISTSNKEALKGRVVTLPEGSVFHAKMQSNVNSETLKKGDNIAAVLTENWVYNGETIAPSGSILYGEAILVEPAGKAYKNGRFEIKFNEIVTPDGDYIQLSSNTYVLAVDMKRPLKIVGNIISSAIVGVVIGSIYTALSGGNVAIGLAIGAMAGAALGSIFSLAQTGNNVELPRNTPIKVRLTQPLKVDLDNHQSSEKMSLRSS